MVGNVWEWMWDEAGAYRVMRGGSWRGGARGGSLRGGVRGCRSASRRRCGPGIRGFNVGFRVSRSVALDP